MSGTYQVCRTCSAAPVIECRIVVRLCCDVTDSRLSSASMWSAIIIFFIHTTRNIYSRCTTVTQQADWYLLMFQLWMWLTLLQLFTVFMACFSWLVFGLLTINLLTIDLLTHDSLIIFALQLLIASHKRFKGGSWGALPPVFSI